MYCKRCGAPLHEGVIICPECGARQSRRFRAVRCASCHRRVPLGLTVCPHCARTVRPAGPRWALWLGGLAVLLVAALWGLGKLPVERVAQEVADVRGRLAGLVQVLGPADTPTAAPVSTPQLVAQAAIEPTPTVVIEPIVTVTPTVEMAEPTSLPETSPTSELTATPAPTETPTPLPPTPTFTPAPPTATPTRSATGRTTYRVQSGDTLSTIATKYGITWEALAAANGLNSRSVLRIGQELVIPVAGSAPTAVPQPTVPPRPAATPPPTPLPPTPAPSLAAPVQLSPGDQTPFSGGDAFVELVWQPVLGMPADGQYQITVRWLEQGLSQEHSWLTTADRTRVPLWLWSKADQPARRYTWTVRVVQVTTDGQGGERVIPLSPASPARIFYWG